MEGAKTILGTTGKTEDDPGILDNEILKYASVRVPLAVTAALLPIVASSVLYVTTFPIMMQIFLGTLLGFLGMFSFQLFSVHRSTARRRKSVQIKQLSELSREDVKRLVTEDGAFPYWTIFQDFDKVEWLNEQLVEVWPFLDKALSEMLRVQLEPILSQYAMGLIKRFTLKNLNLGTKAPRFDGIKVTEGDEDETVLETMFQWSPANEHIVLKVESTGPDFHVKVKDIHVSGTLKFILKPLLEEVPCFGAVLLSFTYPPDVDFNLKFLGGSIDALPGVEKLIDDSIRAALMDSMVWPCRVVIPVAPGNWSHLELRPVGELHVTFIEAQDIIKTDIIGKTDPFCMFYVRQKANKIKRSSTKSNKKSAVWKESFVLEVEDRETQTLTVRLMDEEALEKAQYIGSAELRIASLKPGISEDLWMDMVEDPTSPNKQKTRGRVHLLVEERPLPDNDPKGEAATAQQTNGEELSSKPV